MSSKLGQVVEAVLSLNKSQQKLNKAFIADLEILRKEISQLQAYVQLVEARRKRELEEKKNA